MCLWVFLSLSMLPAGMKLRQECLEMKDGRDETKIWTRCPGAGQGKEPQFFPSPVLSKLTHSCTGAVSKGSLPLLPSKSSAMPCSRMVCSAESDGASPGFSDPSVLPAQACQRQ